MKADATEEWRRAMLDAHDAAVTVMMRGLAIQRAILSGDWTGGAEMQRMVSEKVVAAHQGIAEATRASLREAMTPPATPKAAAKAAKRVVKAAAKPARKKVRTNARWLTKPKKKR